MSKKIRYSFLKLYHNYSEIYPQISLEHLEISVKTKKRRKKGFMVLTKNLEYVTLILIRKNYLQLIS